MTSGIVQQLSKFSTDVKVMRLNGQYGRGFGITCIYNTFNGSGESAAAATVFGISRDAPSQETEQHWLDGATEGSFQVARSRPSFEVFNSVVSFLKHVLADELPDVQELQTRV